MTERFAYLAFVTVVGLALAIMTAGLAAIWVVLLRQNRSRPKAQGSRHKS